MRKTLSRTLAAGALTALVLAGTTVPSVAADEAAPSCDTVALAAAVTAAQQTSDVAKAAFLAAHKPLGQLVSAQRHAAKAELKQSRAAAKALAKQVRTSSTKAERKAAAARLKQERREAAHAQSLLTSKRASLAQIKADKAAAKKAWDAAKAHEHELEALQDSCDDEAETETSDDSGSSTS
jgi:hypothetical protein